VRLGAVLIAGAVAASTAGACGARSELVLPWPPPEPSICDAQFSATVEPVTLVVYMVFDTSGSMAETTTTGNSKWEAVSEAMGEFLLDPEAEGLRVGLSFFPRHDVTVAPSCQGGWGCEPSSACVPYGICEPVGGGLCTQSSQCPDPGDQCVLLGYCTGSGLPCDPSIQLDCDGGACMAVGYCNNHTLCDPLTTSSAGSARCPTTAPRS